MGTIRIVGGALRGRRIPVPERGVRPTAERTREAIFDVLGPAMVLGARVLDLYAGTGALGIEALSRGAARADFAEGDRAVARRLVANLAALGLAERSRVVVADLDRAALPATVAGPWEIVFLDPPYAGDAGSRWLRALAAAPWPREGGLVVHERARGTEVETPAGLSLLTEREYGDTTVAIYRAAHAGPEGAAGKGNA